MYSDTDSLVALSDSSYATDLATSSDSDFDSEYDADVDILDDDEDIPAFLYDVDDPCIEVGVVFLDVKQCKEAITKHAIIHNHAFKPTRTDHNKFRVVCKRANKGCKWRFYATTSKNKYIGCKVYTCIFMYLFLCVTLGLMCSDVLQVKINGPKHTCGSVNNCGDTMASNAWAAARAVELLKEKPSMRPKELQD
jgi:hypothetical protein